MKSTLTNEQLIEKAKQWIKDLCESGGHKWCLRVPADHNHDPDLIFSELCNRLEEYAQQSQPSGMSAEEVKEIAENHFKNTTWLEGTQEQDTKFGFRIGYMKAMKDFAIQNPSTASPAGAAEGASEGMAEALRKDIFRLDELRRFHIEPYNLGEMGEVSKIISRLSKLASLSSPGSGWVSVEDAKPNGRLCAVLVCNNWAPEHKRCTRTAIWFGQTNKFFMDCDNAFTAHEISHWRPLPTPPGVEDNQTKKQ